MFIDFLMKHWTIHSESHDFPFQIPQQIVLGVFLGLQKRPKSQPPACESLDTTREAGEDCGSGTNRWDDWNCSIGAERPAFLTIINHYFSIINHN